MAYMQLSANSDASGKLLMRGGTFRSPCSAGCEEVPQAMRPGLADVKLRTNRTNRGNAVSCQLTGEYLRCLLAQRVRGIRSARHAIRYP